MQTIRCFIAICIDEKTKNLLTAIQDKIKIKYTNSRLIPPKNIHLTLHFIGNIKTSKIEEIKSSLYPVVEKIDAFDIKPAGLGAFPNLKTPKIIWIGIDEGKDNTIFLQKEIARELKKIKIETEERKFYPHLTLARIESNNRGLLTTGFKKTEIPSFDNIHVAKIFIFKSILIHQKPIYEVLSDINLKK